MNWLQQIDAYCERTDFSYWSEPLNAVTNIAFIIVAVIMWRRSAGLSWAKTLCAILFTIGIGSYLFHTHATAWASTADVIPIAGFILTYLFLVNWHVMGWPWWMALGAMLGFLPYAAGLTLILNDIAFIKISNVYWTVPILLLLYAPFVPRQMARGFAIGAAILCLSITLRSLDETLCARWPVGTHFAWHILNAIMLGWMIEVYRRHMLEPPSPQG